MTRDICFDLDGTLTDSGPGIKNSVRYMLARCGLPPQTDAELDRFVGPPLMMSFQAFCGMTEAQAKQAIPVYRAYFKQTGIWENTVHPGIPALLAALRAAGHRLYVVTGKPEIFARQILERFDLWQYFSHLQGIDLNEDVPTAKADLLGAVIRRFGLDPSCMVMVGDRRYDMEGAVAVGATPVGVLYGYGTRQELTAAGAAYLAPSVPALQGILLKE